jgi:hypothetical protein
MLIKRQLVRNVMGIRARWIRLNTPPIIQTEAKVRRRYDCERAEYAEARASEDFIYH